MPNEETTTSSAETTATTTTTINSVSVKLSTFWPDKPQVWFVQAEAQFALRNVSSSLTKYYHVTAILPQDIATDVLDILRAPPTVTHSRS